MGGEPITLTVLGAIAVGVTLVGAAIYIYENRKSITQGFNDGLNGENNYNPCTCN